MMQWYRKALLAGLLMGLMAIPADAQQVPQLLTVQGYLTDSSGAPVTATALTVQATLYDDATASGDSNRLYQVIRRVDVTNGNFTMLLGRPPGNMSDPVIENAVFSRPSLWVGIAVGSDSEMSPRLRVTAVPFAVRAGTADTVQGRAPRACPAGTTDMRTYCIDPVARSSRGLEAMETCYNAHGRMCGFQELFMACRRTRVGEPRVNFTPVMGEWIFLPQGEWHHPDTGGPIMAAVQFSSSNECISSNTVVWGNTRGSPYRFYCCYDPSPLARGE